MAKYVRDGSGDESLLLYIRLLRYIGLIYRTFKMLFHADA